MKMVKNPRIPDTLLKFTKFLTIGQPVFIMNTVSDMIDFISNIDITNIADISLYLTDWICPILPISNTINHWPIPIPRF